MLEVISESNGYLQPFHDDAGFRFLKDKKDTPIYITYREPITRFKSGLEIVYNKFLGEKERYNLSKKHIELFVQQISYLDNVVSMFIPQVSGFPRGVHQRPYHLFDSHIDHSLWRPLLLLAYGYDVRMIPLNEYTDHLLTYYPENKKIILQDRKNRPSRSFDSNRNIALTLWDSYKQVFIDDEFSHLENWKIQYIKKDWFSKYISWDEWMNPEIQIFNALHKFKEKSNLNLVCKNLLKKLLREKVYFANPFNLSVVHATSLLKLIRDVHDTSLETIPEVNSFIKDFQQITHYGIRVSEIGRKK